MAPAGGPGLGTGRRPGRGRHRPFGGDPVIGTYHAYAGRLVSDNALREGLEPSMRLITPALSWQLAAQIVAAYDGPMDEIIWTPQTVTAAVLELAGDLAEHLREPGTSPPSGAGSPRSRTRCRGGSPRPFGRYLHTQRAREQLLPLVSRYAAAKAAREVLDHSDQVALAARIASSHPEVGAAERARYQVVLLDEYQDTSHAQLVLLRALFGGGHPVTAVGDPCQSIYGWRGASAGNLRRFTADFPVVPGPAVRGLGAAARAGAAAVDQLPQLRAGARRGRGVQEELRYEAPDVPRLVSGAGPGRARGGGVRPAGHGAGRGRVGGRAGRRAARVRARMRARRAAVAGRRAGRRAAVGHRRAVPEAVAVRAAAAGHRGPRHPGRGGRARRPARGARGAGRGGDAAGAARRGRVGRAGPAAHRAALADRPRDLVALGRRARALARGRTGDARPDLTPGARPSGPPDGRTSGRAGGGDHRPDRGDRQPGRGAR